MEGPKYGLQRYFLRFPEFWKTIDDFRGIALFLLFAWTIALGGAGAELLTDMMITNYEYFVHPTNHPNPADNETEDRLLPPWYSPLIFAG